MLSFTILATSLVISQALVLQTNEDEIEPGRTQDVRLICWVDDSDGSTLKIPRLLQIRVSKLSSLCSKERFADVHFNTNDTFAADNDVTVSTGVNSNDTSFLEIWWSVATKNTAGAYECEINGFDINDELVNLRSTPAIIKERVLTIGDVQKLIELTTQTYKMKLKELEKENAHLKNFISTEFDKLREQAQDQRAVFDSEMSQLKQDIGDKYVKKEDFVSTVFTVKNFTSNEIMSDNLNDNKIHSQIYDEIQNVERNSEANYSKMESASESFRSKLNEQLRQIDQNHQKSFQEMETQLTKVASTITTLNAKYKNITDNLTKKVTTCSPPTVKPKRTDPLTSSTTFRTRGPKLPATTVILSNPQTASPKTSSSIKWPEGNFAMLKPATGCPNPREYFRNGRNLFAESSIDIYNLQPPGRVSHKNVFIVDGRDSKVGGAKLCLTTGSQSAKRPLWPRGSYCINEVPNETCPQQFKPGFAFFKAKSGRGVVYSYMIQFCCRSDGKAATPVQLPTENAFVLYRKSGACQKVKDMDLEASGSLSIVAENDLEIETSVDGSSPDLNINYTSIQLCHYAPKF